MKTRVDATFHNEKAHYFGEIPRTQDDHAGSLQGAPPLLVMFWSRRSSAFFFLKHVNTQISLFHRLQFKSLRADLRPTHATPPYLLCCPPQTLHFTTPHTRFCHNTLTCSAIFRRALADAGFSDRVFRHPSRFPRPIFHHRRPISPAGSKKLRSIPNKISKIESQGGK